MVTNQKTSQTESKDAVQGKKQRGFAAMDAAQQKAISAKGGRAAHESGNAHEFSSEEARAAGRKGGRASHQAMQAARLRSQRQEQEEAMRESVEIAAEESARPAHLR